jgi:exopolysaccharide production protein ExoQ
MNEGLRLGPPADAVGARTGPPSSWASRLDIRAVTAVVVFAGFVIIGDMTWVERDPLAPVVTSAIAAALVAVYVVAAPARADRLDRGVLLSLVLFAVAGAFSQFPRQSFDSVLAVLVYVSGLFVARGILARQSGRRAFVVALMVLSVTLTLVTTVLWLTLYLRWWSLTQWSVVPPLGMNLPSMPWGHRHDLALLLALLYPSWWIGRITRVRAATAILVGALTLFLVVIGGSRTVWLAVAGATAVVATPLIAHRLGWSRIRLGLLAAILSLFLLFAVGSGLAGPLVERIIGGASITERATMWGPIIEAWTERPVAGYGPGSFPWVLQLTGYFDTHSFSPRHPDSAILQLLGEAGIVGIVALAVLAVTVLPQVIKGQSKAAGWATVAFALAALGGNPTDFGFMVAIAIGWLAFTSPRKPGSLAGMPRALWRPTRVMAVVALGVVGLAFAATVLAGIAYTSARTSVARGRLQEAALPLSIASALDPSLAIYPRQLGTLRLVSDEPEAAVEELERAVALNPSDDLAWRILALAYAEAGDEPSSWTAIDRALAIQRSDPTNLLLAVRAGNGSDDPTESRRLLSEIAQAWPEIVASPAWRELISETSATTDILKSARDRWARGAPSPEPLTSQPLLLDAMTSTERVTIEPGESRLGLTLAAAYLAVMRCDPAAAAALDATDDRDRRQATYWALAVRLTELEGGSSDRIVPIFTIMTGDPLLADPPPRTLNPLHENGARGSSADRWGYRRAPIEWPPTQWDLPSPRAGLVNWYLEPNEAVHVAGLDANLPGCQ